MTPNFHPTEHQEQVLFIGLFEFDYPHLRILAIPNAGKRSRKHGASMVAEGLKAGVPDLFIPAINTWVEMKRVQGGKLSEYQKDWIEYLKSIGHNVIVAKGADDGMRQIKEILGEPADPLKHLF